MSSSIFKGHLITALWYFGLSQYLLSEYIWIFINLNDRIVSLQSVHIYFNWRHKIMPNCTCSIYSYPVSHWGISIQGDIHSTSTSMSWFHAMMCLDRKFLDLFLLMESHSLPFWNKTKFIQSMIITSLPQHHTSNILISPDYGAVSLGTVSSLLRKLLEYECASMSNCS